MSNVPTYSVSSPARKAKRKGFHRRSRGNPSELAGKAAVQRRGPAVKKKLKSTTWRQSGLLYDRNFISPTDNLLDINPRWNEDPMEARVPISSIIVGNNPDERTGLKCTIKKIVWRVYVNQEAQAFTDLDQCGQASFRLAIIKVKNFDFTNEPYGFTKDLERSLANEHGQFDEISLNNLDRKFTVVASAQGTLPVPTLSTYLDDVNTPINVQQSVKKYCELIWEGSEVTSFIDGYLGGEPAGIIANAFNLYGFGSIRQNEGETTTYLDYNYLCRVYYEDSYPQ